MKKVYSWILFAVIFAIAIPLQLGLKDWIKDWIKGGSSSENSNTSQSQKEKGDSIITEIETFSRINSQKLMDSSLTREASESHTTLKAKYQPLPPNLEGEFHCTTASLFGKNSGVAKGKLECVASVNFATRLIINFTDPNKELEYFQSDKFKVIGKITSIKIPSPEEIRVIQLNKGLLLSLEYPTTISISGDPVLIRK